MNLQSKITEVATIEEGELSSEKKRRGVKQSYEDDSRSANGVQENNFMEVVATGDLRLNKTDRERGDSRSPSKLNANLDVPARPSIEFNKTKSNIKSTAAFAETGMQQVVSTYEE